jgi:type VI secretion system VasD/TssJ family lipoprotein
MNHADMNLTELEELKTQYLAIDEFFIDPATVKPAPFNLLENTQYLGVVVSFRDIEKSKWRTWIKIPEGAFLSDLRTKKTFEIVINKLDVVINLPYSKSKEFSSDE